MIRITPNATGWIGGRSTLSLERRALLGIGNATYFGPSDARRSTNHQTGPLIHRLIPTLMKTRSRHDPRRFQLKLLGYGNCYYIERTGELERALARKPRAFQIDLIGVGEIPADSALLIRSVLLNRSPKTRLITNARSSLQNGSVLVWLLGDTRLIRDDARVFFRRATLSEDDEPKQEDDWKDEPEFCDSFSEIDPEEGHYARVLQCINEFLPVKELAGRLIEVPVLRQFGLVENEKVDHFLATAFGAKREPPNFPLSRTQDKPVQGSVRLARTRPAQR